MWCTVGLFWFLQQQKKKNSQPMQCIKGDIRNVCQINESDFWGLYWFLWWQNLKKQLMQPNKKICHNEGITINHCGTVVLHGVASLQKVAKKAWESSGKNTWQHWALACALAFLQNQKSDNQQEKKQQSTWH